MANILIIDDDQLICEMLSRQINYMGHDAAYAKTLKAGLEHLSSDNYDAVLLDVRLPDGNGLEALPEIRNTPSRPEVIIITGEGDPDGAELAIKNDAWDYLEKPLTAEKIELSLVRVLEYRTEKEAKTSPTTFNRNGIIGGSPELLACIDLAGNFAGSDSNILLTGETGTGKDLLARAIHKNSPRVDEAFVVVDCASLPETLVDGILFGHAKGAYTGAHEERTGIIKEADGGTLFLDEVGELPLSIQKSFLRVLQEHSFRPLGGRKEIKSDFRLIAATNRNLEKMVSTGHFRRDLLFRLQSVTIELPPLRLRPQDIKELVMYFVINSCELSGSEIKGFSPGFFETLYIYDWPGNVRELMNTVESMLVIVRDEPTLYPRHLPSHVRIPATRASVKSHQMVNKNQANTQAQTQKLPTFKEVINIAQAEYLQNLMLAASEVKEACRVSGLSRSQLYHLLRKHNISRPA